jgi:hypothetical protein
MSSENDPGTKIAQKSADLRFRSPDITSDHGESSDGREDWWAECLLCAWVTTSNRERRGAEEQYGRHYEREHLPTR